MSITYNLSIPNPPNIPVQDVTLMQQNTNGIDNWNQVDHYTFSSNSPPAGQHKQVTLGQTRSNPATQVTTASMVYSKVFGTSNVSELFYADSRNGSGFSLFRYVPSVKGVCQFTIPNAIGACTITTGNVLNYNIATVTKSAANRFDIVFTQNLDYALYFVNYYHVMSTSLVGNFVMGTLSPAISGFSIITSINATTNDIIGFMVMG